MPLIVWEVALYMRFVYSIGGECYERNTCVV